MDAVTIKDLAERLDVSPSTVSRALNNHPAISEATKTRVKKLAEELRYQPNLLAQGLQKKRVNVVGVIVPEIRHHFFSAVISGIEEIMHNAGFTIMVCQSIEDPQREIDNLEALMSHQISGLMISISENTTNNGQFSPVISRGIPLVFFDRVIEGIDTSCVVVDDYEGAFQAVKHLIESGYRDIAYIGGPEHLNIQKDRFMGYKMALEKYKIEMHPEWVIFSGLNEKDGVEAARVLLKENRPRAIFCINDPVAMGVYSVVQRNGLRIPEDVAIVGFTDDPMGRYMNPPLTTISQPKAEMGKTAARLLLEQMNQSQDEFIPRVIKLQTKLIRREST